MSKIQFLIGRRPTRSYSPGALAIIALLNSALMDETD